VSEDDAAELLRIDPAAWLAEAESTAAWFATFGSTLPPRLGAQLQLLRERLVADAGRGHDVRDGSVPGAPAPCTPAVDG